MTATILTGDCRAVMRTMEPRSVQMCMTSIPYWGLRDYKIPPSVWGGDPGCRHRFGPMQRGKRKDMLPADKTKSTSRSGTDERQNGASHNGGNFCTRCGAWRGCYGLEPTYQLYLEHTVEVFNEVWRVLRDDGLLFLNIGDCYATRPCGWSAQKYRDEDRDDRTFRDKPFATISTRQGKSANKGNGGDGVPNQRVLAQGGLKEKDLCGMPWRVAFALQDAGWWLRRDNIWHKKNPMPESVYDRTTTAHEYLFQFSKSGDTLLWRHQETGAWVYEKPEPDYRWRNRVTRDVVATKPKHDTTWFRFNLWRGFDYYYDFAATMEPSSPDSHARAARSRSAEHKHSNGAHVSGKPQGIAIGSPVAGRPVPVPAGWAEGMEGHHGSIHPDGRRQEVGVGHNGRPSKGVPNGAGRRALPANWKQGGPNSRFHKDFMPGGTRKLAPHDTEGPRTKNNDSFDRALFSPEIVPMRNKRSVWSIASEPFKGAHFATFPTKLVEPCILAGCPKGGVVLDPFGGAGTVAVVAERLGRDSIIIEIKKTYAKMAEKRIVDDRDRRARKLMGREERQRAAIKSSGKLKSPKGLPLFSPRKAVTRDKRKGAKA